ncbi:MAG TPA: hypothetical protein VJI67_01570, partial [archaeon]|nr:hypothetical protein [archaeon]
MTLSVLGRRSCRARLLTVLALLLVLPGIAFVDATNRVVNGECKCIDGDGGVTNECFNDPVGVDCCSEAVNVDDKCTPPAGVLAWNVGGNCRITCSGSPGSFLKVELDRGVSVKGSSLLSFKDAVVDFNSNASPSVFGSGSLKFSFSRGYFSNTLLSFEDTSTGEVSDSNLDLNEYNNRTNFKVTGTSNVTIKNSILKDAGLGGDFQDREMNDITNETPESTLSLENVKMTIVGTPASQAETAALQLTANMTATIKDSEIERLLIVSGSDGSGYNRIFTMQDFKAGEVVNATASTTGGEFGNLSVTATNSKFNNVTVKTPQFSPGDNTEVLNNFKEVVFSMEPTNGQNPIDSYHPLFQFDSKNFFEDADFEGDKVYFRVRSKNYFKDDTLLNNLKNGVWNWDTADKSKLSKVMTELVVGSSDALDSADHLPDFNGVVEFRETEGGSVSYGVGLGVEKAHRIFPAFFFNEQRKLINHNDPGVVTRGYARIYLCDYVNNDDVRNATIPCRPPLGKTCSEMTIEDDEPPGLGDVNCVVSKGYLDIGFKSDYENGRGLPFDTATQKYYYKVLFKDDDAPTEEPALSANGPFGLDSDTPFARTVGAPCPSDDPDVASYNALTGFYEIKSNWLITNVTIDCPEDTKLELLKDANVVVDTGGKLILNNSQVRQSTSLVPGNQKTGMIQLKSDGVLELKGDTDLSVAVDASANAVFKAVDSDVNEDVSLRMNSIARFDNVTLYGNTVPQQNERNFLKAFDNSILTFDASALNTFNGSVSLSNSAFVDMRESVFEDLTLSTTTPSDFATLNTIKNLSLRGVSTATDFAGWPAPLEQSAVTTSLGVLNAEHVLKGNVNVSGTWTVTAPGKLKRHYPIRVFDGGSPVNGATVRMLNRGNETDGVTPLPEVTGATGADGFVVQADYASKMFARVENANQNGSFTLKAKS